MIGEPVLLTVRKKFPRPEPAHIEALGGVPTGFIVDSQNGTGALGYRIKPLTNGMSFTGVAMTAQAEPRDMLPVQPAIALASPGDVLVISTAGYDGAAIIGDNVAVMAKNKGLAAVVTDGLVRDVEGILEADIPVFSAGVSPNSPYSRGPGSIGLPVALGDSVIHPGDLLVGDRDGVVVIARNQAGTVIDKLVELRNMEAALEAKVKSGLTHMPWVDDYLSSDKVRYVE